MNSNPPGSPNRKERLPAAVSRLADAPETGPVPDDAGGDDPVQSVADRVLLQAELKWTKGQAAVMATEVRTLRERLVILRASAAALEQKVRMQSEDLEKYHHALMSLNDHVKHYFGQALLDRARWLLHEYSHRGIRGRLKLLPRISEFLEFQAPISEAVWPHPDWPQVRAELEAIRGRKWYRQVFDPHLYKRTVRNFVARLRKSA